MDTQLRLKHYIYFYLLFSSTQPLLAREVTHTEKKDHTAPQKKEESILEQLISPQEETKANTTTKKIEDDDVLKTEDTYTPSKKYREDTYKAKKEKERTPLRPLLIGSAAVLGGGLYYGLSPNNNTNNELPLPDNVSIESEINSESEPNDNFEENNVLGNGNAGQGSMSIQVDSPRNEDQTLTHSKEFPSKVSVLSNMSGMSKTSKASRAEGHLSRQKSEFTTNRKVPSEDMQNPSAPPLYANSQMGQPLCILSESDSDPPFSRLQTDMGGGGGQPQLILLRRQ